MLNNHVISNIRKSYIFCIFQYKNLCFQVKMSADLLEELLFFSDLKKFPLKTIQDFSGSKPSFVLLFKRTNDSLSGNIDDVVLQMVYGNSRQPPGDDNSPALKLKKVWTSEKTTLDWMDAKDNLDHLSDVDEKILLGIWAPSNALNKGTVLKLLLPTLSGPFKMPELEEVPFHVAIAYDAFKAKEVFELSEKYPGKVLSYGYFSSDRSGEAKLLGKTTEQYDARNATITYEEKLVIQLAKDDPQCFMDFIDLGPSYISTDIEIGELDCRYFFPPGYNTPEAEIITYLKKKSKRKGRLGKLKIPCEQETDAQSVVTTGTDMSIIDDALNVEDEANGSEEDAGQEEDNAADKATSPME
ncbi:hypothetical protein ABEB36_011673 [Hypothenemus hampei]|uniref:DUF4746 domain-containing protein n=1 Tax=Hypothenemus hampei TaxID=57062 RepID=A0ABD1EAQ3_HYPHA